MLETFEYSDLVFPDKRISVAKGIINRVAGSLQYVQWIGGYGSFWGEKSHPGDIDLVVFVRPSFLWGITEQDCLVKPLEKVFQLPVDLYSINNTAVLLR